MARDAHPYVRYGGGSSRVDLHSNKVTIERPEFLIYREEKARKASISSSGGGTHEIYYELLGSGPKKVVFVMGLAGSHTEWECNAPCLGEEYTVCVFDNRGVGLSDSPPGRWTTSGMASDCNQLLDLLASEDSCDGENWQSRVHIIGSSMGGMIALEAVLLNPSRFLSLTLLSTHAGGILASLPPISSLTAFARTFTSKDLVDLLDNSLVLKFPLHYVQGETADGEPRREALVKQIMRRQRKFVEGGFELKLSAVALLKQVFAVTTHYISWHRLYYLRRAMCGNVLVIAGVDDNLVKPSNSDMLAKELGGKLDFVPDAGHALQDQVPDVVNNSIFSHLEKCESKSKSKKVRLTSSPPRTHPYVAYGTICLLAYVLRKRFRWNIHWSAVLGALLVASKEFSG